MPRTTLAVHLATTLAAALVGMLAAGPHQASAQTPPGPTAAAAPLAQAAAPPAPWTTNGQLSDAQLDQLTAPIALYPDALVAQILVAATYPLQIVEADRWRSDPANAELTGTALLAALQGQPWDLSVKALVPFSQVLQMMDANLQWTESIGEAFVTQQDELMDSIQRLRQRAAMAGALTSTPQQNVSTLDQSILIDPANADEVYVPDYDPDTVYGLWPWPSEPPCNPRPPGAAPLYGAAPVGFGHAVLVPAPLWGWPRWHWRRHVLDVALPDRPAQERPWRYRQPLQYHSPPERTYPRAAPTVPARQAHGPSVPFPAQRAPPFGSGADRRPQRPSGMLTDRPPAQSSTTRTRGGDSHPAATVRGARPEPAAGHLEKGGL